jgi:hypothetical protein
MTDVAGLSAASESTSEATNAGQKQHAGWFVGAACFHVFRLHACWDDMPRDPQITG